MRFASALVDVMDDGTKEVIVYVRGRGRCGSGGCVMLILAPEGEPTESLQKQQSHVFQFVS